MKFKTTGYRGPLTNNTFIPPGDYEVGGDMLDLAAGRVPEVIVAYVVSIELGQVYDDAPVPVVLTIEDPDAGINDASVETSDLLGETGLPWGWQQADLEAMEMPALQSLLESRNLDPEGTKTELIQRFLTHLGIPWESPAEPAREWADLDDLPINDLRAMCTARDLPGNGSKAALIARLIEHGD